jgi:hypothetical protein
MLTMPTLDSWHWWNFHAISLPSIKTLPVSLSVQPPAARPKAFFYPVYPVDVGKENPIPHFRPV